MKGGECKVPIQGDQLSFLEKRELPPQPGGRKVAIAAAVLLLTVMAFMTVFTVQSINGIESLQQEVQLLKTAVEALQQEVAEKRQEGEAPTLLKIPKDYVAESFAEYAYDYASYEDYYDENHTQSDYTKDAKQATPSPRTKRSIIGYPAHSEEYQATKVDVTRKSTYSYPEYDQTTPEPRQIATRRIHVRPDQEDMETHRHRQRRLEFDDRHVRQGRMKPLPAAHFSGDTSKYVLGQHDNFNGNGHLSHPQRVFVDWVESSWFHPLGMDRHFGLSDGVLTIRDPGLYFIYAQVYYYDEHDVNGFRVHRNDNETLLQCTTTTHSTDRVLKGNTCFTAAAEYLNENDRISLGDISLSRYSLFEPGKSFFGVIKLGDVKIK